MQLRLEFQRNPVADEVSAVTAVVRPILEGLLNSLKEDVVAEVGGIENVKLKMLPRLHRAGDGDCGICFEYAVHDAMNRSEATVQERLIDALHYCNVPGSTSGSILFGAEKSGALRLIDTVEAKLTDESRLHAGNVGAPVKLKRHVRKVVEAFRKRKTQLQLPLSISGIWKADLFVGFTDSDRWVATTVKINRTQLQAAKGLRIGIVPTREGQSDAIVLNQQKNLVVCPIPHDEAFMQVFYQGWVVVQQFLHADAQVPREAYLPRPPDRQVARLLEDRREYPVLEVIDALKPLAQPELLDTSPRQPQLVEAVGGETELAVLEAPLARRV